MKRGILALMLVAVMLFAFTSPSFAVETEDVSGIEEIDDDSVGILPDSPFYFLKTFVERVRIFLTFNELDKARLMVEIATVKLAEADLMEEADNPEAAATAIQLYRDYLGKIKEIIGNYETSGDAEAMNQELDQSLTVQVAALEALVADTAPENMESVEEAIEEAEEVLEDINEDAAEDELEAEDVDEDDDEDDAEDIEDADDEDDEDSDDDDDKTVAAPPVTPGTQVTPDDPDTELEDADEEDDAEDADDEDDEDDEDDDDAEESDDEEDNGESEETDD